MTGLLNVALFLLTVKLRSIVVLAALTVVAWLFLSDYYFAPWPWWMDQFAFIAVSVLVLVVLTLTVYHVKLRRVARGQRSAFSLIRKSDNGVEVQLQNWCAMLGTVAQDADGLWREYWNWYRSRLETLDQSVQVGIETVGSIWWTRRSGMLTWARACWLPVLWVALVLGPLHTNLMEDVASVLGRNPQVIFAITCIARDPQTHKRLEESLQIAPGGFIRAGRCVFVSDGSFTVSSTAFPRVHRRLVVSCAERCSLSEHEKATPQLDLVLAVQAGASSFEWIQTNPEPPLKMTLSLVRQDGGILNTAVIEPR